MTTATLETPTPVKPRATTRRRSTTFAIVRGCWNIVRAIAGWVPITLRGLIAMPLLASILYFLGVRRHDNVVLALSAGGVLLCVLGILCVFLTGLWVRLRMCRLRPAEELHLSAGVATRTDFHLGWVHWNPLMKIDVAWEHPGDVAVRTVSVRGRLTEEVTPATRAWCDGITRRIGISDVLGLARVTFRVRQARPVRILPEHGRIDELNIHAQYMPGEGLGHPDGKPFGDLIETRKYGPGDPLKLVLWKVYARTGRMLVRMPEKSVAVCDKVLAYLVAGDRDERSAGVARTLLETGRLGGNFLFAADGGRGIAQTVADALEQVAASVNSRGDNGHGLAEFLDQGSTTGVKACVLFLPARPGGWLSSVETAIRGFGGSVHAIVAAEDENFATPRGAIGRWLMGNTDGNIAELRAIAERLQSAGARVSVVKASNGEIVGAK